MDHEEATAIEELDNKLTAFGQLLRRRERRAHDARFMLKQLVAVKQLQRNIHNDMSMLACILAKEYLTSRHHLRPYCAIGKHQNSPGLDVDCGTMSGQRVVAEIKTTTPAGDEDFGSAQYDEIEKDLDRLRSTEAKHKYFFVTDREAYELMQDPSSLD